MFAIAYTVFVVVWNVNDHFVENVVASAATNGVIITWDLNKPGRNKQGQYAACNFVLVAVSRSLLW